MATIQIGLIGTGMANTSVAFLEAVLNRRCGSQDDQIQILQWPTRAEELDIAIFTGYHPDPLELSSAQEAGWRHFKKLFQSLRYREGRRAPYAVVNYDDRVGRDLCEHLRVPYITYGTHPDAHIRGLNMHMGLRGMALEIQCPLGKNAVELKMSGHLHLLSALAAYATGIALRVPPEQLIEALQSVPEPAVVTDLRTYRAPKALAG